MHQGVQTPNEFRSTLFQSRKYVFDVFRACRKQMLSDHLRQFLQREAQKYVEHPSYRSTFRITSFITFKHEREIIKLLMTNHRQQTKTNVFI